MTRLESHLLNRYPDGSERRDAARVYVQRVVEQYVEAGLADENYIVELCSGDDARYWQRLSEALFANELLDAGFELHPSRGGPDLLMRDGGLNIWIEVICPQPSGIPAEWLESPPNRVISFPHEALLLRWTSALKEKAEKLLGNARKQVKGYLEKGVVGADDAYVIGVNARLLRGVFPALNGISQFPFAAEAVFGFGPLQLVLDRQTRLPIERGHQHRPFVVNANRASVPAYMFLDESFAAVSAVWAADMDECGVIGNPQPKAVVHNPNALVPLPVCLLPSHYDFVASRSGETEYVLNRVEGSAGHRLPRTGV